MRGGILARDADGSDSLLIEGATMLNSVYPGPRRVRFVLGDVARIQHLRAGDRIHLASDFMGSRQSSDWLGPYHPQWVCLRIYSMSRPPP